MQLDWHAEMHLWTIAATITLTVLQGNAEGARESRAAVSTEDYKWRDGIIFFNFDDTVSMRLQSKIREAMNKWEDSTCLLFRARNADHLDYVEFSSHPNDEYCTHDSIGRRGGRQLIKLGYSCQDKGEIMHILGHVIGLWHEQGRPDRNKFVRIREENIEEGQEENFVKHNDFGIDYQGIGYDFGSIMHLRAAAFSKDGSDTTEVRDETEYSHQGKPTLGQRTGPSERDFQQVNYLYSCSADGQRGILRIHIMGAVSLGETTDPRVEITVVDMSGGHTVLSTTEKPHETFDARNPEWDESFELPIDEPPPFEWQFFRLRILGGKGFDDRQLSMSETVCIEPGEHTSLRHCTNTQCHGVLTYGYEFLPDGDECDPNPCMHDGTCTDGFVDYECDCPRGSGGKNCEIDTIDDCQTNPCDEVGTAGTCQDRFFDFFCQCKSFFSGKDCGFYDCAARNPCENGGTCQPARNSKRFECQCRSAYTPESNCRDWDSRILEIFIRGARGLPDTDPDFIFTDRPDPYLALRGVISYTRDGGGTTTPTRGGTQDPDWNHPFRPGYEAQWTHFYFKVHDEDGGFRGGNDGVSSGQDFFLNSIGSFPACNLHVDLAGAPGVAIFDVYYFNSEYPRGQC